MQTKLPRRANRTFSLLISIKLWVHPNARIVLAPWIDSPKCEYIGDLKNETGNFREHYLFSLLNLAVLIVGLIIKRCLPGNGSQPLQLTRSFDEISLNNWKIMLIEHNEVNIFRMRKKSHTKIKK